MINIYSLCFGLAANYFKIQKITVNIDWFKTILERDELKYTQGTGGIIFRVVILKLFANAINYAH